MDIHWKTNRHKDMRPMIDLQRTLFTVTFIHNQGSVLSWMVWRLNKISY